ncbi:hypothetical protein ACHAXT_002031 [Thalassiosira profunda]
MLDLLAFAAAAALARSIGRNVLPPPSSSGADARPKLDRDASLGGGSSSRSTVHPQFLRRASRLAFHCTLLASLILFALSILEAAPSSLLVLVDGASSFVVGYRALLWALCGLLLCVHPLLIGVALGTALFGAGGSGGAAAAAPSSSPRNRSDGGVRRGKRATIASILWTGARCFMVTLMTIVWRLFRKLAGAVIPYRITRANAGGCGVAGMARKCLRSCSAGVVAAALASLSFSAVALATLGSLTLHFQVDGTDETFADVAVPFGEGAPRSLLDYVSLRFMVSVLCAFGMIVASLLNGFGCASLPHTNLVGLFLKPTPVQVIAKVEEDCYYAAKQLEEKRMVLSDAMQQQQQQSGAGRSPSAFGTPSKPSSPEEAQTKQLRDEVVFLENLVGDMKDDIDEMKHSQQQALAARTSAGRIRGVAGVVFSIVLVVRVLVAAKSLGGSSADAPSSNARDPLTSISLYLLGRNLVSERQYDLFRQGTSLVLAGVLSASQVRAFFRVVGALGRKLSRAFGVSLHDVACLPMKTARSGQGAGTSVALLLCSFVMGCYFLACVSVVKMTLPVEYRASFSTAVGLNFAFNTKLLNVIFFASACVSAATLASLFGIQRNNSERYQMDSQLSASRSQLA